MLVVLPVAALPRLWAACTDQGMLWPDEIYQGPEQGHRLAFGYGLVPWEFQQGARSWIYPGLLGVVFKGLSLLGIRHGLGLMIAAKCLMALWALIGVFFAMKLAERLAGLGGSLAAGLLLATFPPSLAYDARCTTEAMTGPLLVAATFFATDSDRDAQRPASTRALWAAGALAATAVALRPPNAIVLVGLLVALLVGRRWKDAKRYVLAATCAIASAGLLDAATWGAPFHSLVGYLRFNLLEGKAAQFGVEPFTFYADVAWTSVGFAVVAIGSGLLFESTQALGPVLIVLAYLLAHSLEPHKELRFLLPVVPLGLALAGAGIAHGMFQVANLTRKSGEPMGDGTVRRAATASVILALAMAYHASDLTLADLGWGRRTDDPSDAEQPELHLPAWRYMDSPNRLLAQAGEQSDICALALAGLNVLWTGGYAYLHRDVPFYPIS
ncbi:MAG: glycosyltransferase family 39 protein, partial [Polyangiaceae bacterium]